jgi:hypothetical protein
MADSFGTRLRMQRERRRISLSCIAEQTKINLVLLEGLERDDVSRWPEGIFRRAFIRAYARIIGLDADSVVQEFVRLYPDSTTSATAAAAPSEGASESTRPPTRLWYLLQSALPLPGWRSVHVGRRPGSGVTKATDATPRAKTAPAQPAPDFAAVAHLCTELGRVADAREVPPLLERAAKILDAVGLVVWIANPLGTALTPALACGYSDGGRPQLPSVRCDTDNATATAFRSAEPRIVMGTDQANGAVVVPLITPSGCVGVLAFELRHGGEQRESVCAVATIFAAQLAALVGFSPLAEAARA